MTENEKKAANLCQNVLNNLFSVGKGKTAATEMAERLSAAGLLRTELDDRAREACKRRAGAPETWGAADPHSLEFRDASRECILVGRDIIAAEKPVERWTVLCPDKGCALFVYDNGANTGKSFPHDAEPEARAYVARKNAESAR